MASAGEHRWLQFSLRGLLAVTTLAGLFLSWPAMAVRDAREREASEAQLRHWVREWEWYPPPNIKPKRRLQSRATQSWGNGATGLVRRDD